MQLLIPSSCYLRSIKISTDTLFDFNNVLVNNEIIINIKEIVHPKNENFVIIYSPSCRSKPV